MLTGISVMKFMGWSWDQYCSAPRELVHGIIDEINRQGSD